MKRPGRPALVVFFLTLTMIWLWPPESFESVRARYLSSERSLLDQQGRILHRWRVDPRQRRLEWIEREAIAPFLIEALVRVEDKRFFEHPGVDWRALARIPYDAWKGEPLRGGSTISMQLAGRLDPSLQTGGRQRDVWQKIRQIHAALRLDLYWSKNEILEAYWNQVSFRGEWEGLSAASQGLFHKDPHGLNRIESVILVSLLARPNASQKTLAERACRLGTLWKLDCSEIRLSLSQGLARLPFFRHKDRSAPHLARFLKAEQAVVRTFLDRDLQVFAQSVVEEQIESLRLQNVADAAVLVVEQRSGKVLAYVGSSARYSRSPDVDGVRALRQAGSTLKPFLYAQAIAANIIDSKSLIADEPTQIQTASGLYTPQNYDHLFRGPMTVAEALAESRNIPAVKVLDLVSVPRFHQLLKDLGFKNLAENSYYGHSLALGAADVSLWDLTQAYTALANQGRGASLRLSEADAAVEADAIFSPAAAYTVADILSDKNSRAGSFGLDNALATAYWSAVKTGTSKDMRDNWCLGFSERYTVGVWVGNFDGSPMWNVSGVSGAAPIWRQIMDQLHSQEGSSPPPLPTGFVQPSSKLASAQSALLSIRYPVDLSFIAYDPDIPAANQALFFETNSPLPVHFTWVLDGRNLRQNWVPIHDLTPGRHILILKNEKNMTVDTVRFELRGKALNRL